MDAHKLQVKVFFESGSQVGLEEFIPVLHDWIKHNRLGELLIDVANYAHVPQGPGVALIGHATDYYVDEAGGRPGLLTSRKRDPLPPGERLPDLFRRALRAAALLEKETVFAGKLRCRTDELLFRINDRLAAPNTEATFAAIRPELETFVAKLFGTGGYKVEWIAAPKDLFSVRIVAQAKTELAELSSRLG